MKNFKKEVTTATVDLGKSIAEDIVRPTSKSIGDNIGLMVDGVMGWLGYWGQKQQIKREAYLNSYKKKITEEILKISDNNLIEPPLRIVGPAIEASKFFIEEEFCRNMFAKLISSSCDTSLTDTVHPSFPEIIKQLTPIDAKFLNAFTNNATFPAVELYIKHENGQITPFLHLLIDFKGLTEIFDQDEQLELTKTIDNLLRFGLLKKNREIIELNYDYNNFRQHWYYKKISSNAKNDEQIKMYKYRIELTILGKDFVKCCIPKSEDCEKTLLGNINMENHALTPTPQLVIKAQKMKCQIIDPDSYSTVNSWKKIINYGDQYIQQLVDEFQISLINLGDGYAKNISINFNLEPEKCLLSNDNILFLKMSLPLENISKVQNDNFYSQLYNIPIMEAGERIRLPLNQTLNGILISCIFNNAYFSNFPAEDFSNNMEVYNKLTTELPLKLPILSIILKYMDDSGNVYNKNYKLQFEIEYQDLSGYLGIILNEQIG